MLVVVKIGIDRASSRQRVRTEHHEGRQLDHPVNEGTRHERTDIRSQRLRRLRSSECAGVAKATASVELCPRRSGRQEHQAAHHAEPGQASHTGHVGVALV
jgi:hypothetical protein